MTPDPDAWQRFYRIEGPTGYTPAIGHLVDMLAYARMTTEYDVRGLTVEQLDATAPGFANSIGMLLAHIAATDRIYQHLSFWGVDPITADLPEYRPYVGAMTFGAQGERVTGRTLEEHLADLRAAREETLAELSRRDDPWLASRLMVPDFDYPNHHWAWFHVMEDEVSHRGQIRVLHRALGL